MPHIAVKNNKNIELKKHVHAIHCSNNLTLVQRKLFNAYPELPNKQSFEIKGKELYKLIGYNSKDTFKLKEALLGLISTVIEWNVIDGLTRQEKNGNAAQYWLLPNYQAVFAFMNTVK